MKLEIEETSKEKSKKNHKNKKEIIVLKNDKIEKEKTSNFPTKILKYLLYMIFIITTVLIGKFILNKMNNTLEINIKEDKKISNTHIVESNKNHNE